jgi:putative transposase
VILDVFSRYIVGWTVQYKENGQLAKALIEQATEQQQITPKMLTLHADRGGPMRAKPVAFLLADLRLIELDRLRRLLFRPDHARRPGHPQCR